MIENLPSDIKFTETESALLKHNNKEEKEVLPFVTQHQPSVSTLGADHLTLDGGGG